MTGPNPPLTFCRDCSHDEQVHGPDGCQAEVLGHTVLQAQGDTELHGEAWHVCGCELYLEPEAARVGDWGPPPAPRAGRGISRSPEVDAMVAELKARPGEQRVVDRAPGRGSGQAWAYRARGCEVTTRRDGHWTLIWAWWPAATPTEGNTE